MPSAAPPRDGAVWIGQLQPDGTSKRSFKRPAVLLSATSPNRCRAAGEDATKAGRWLADGETALRRARRGGVFAFRFLQRGALEDAVRAAARRLRRGPPAPHASHRAHGRGGLLVQRHALALHRGRRQRSRCLLGQHQRHRRSGPRYSADRHPSHDRGACRATPPPAVYSWRSRPIACSRAPASCSIPTIATWAISTDRNTGPTCCRGVWARRRPARSWSGACRSARRRRARSA